MSGPSTTKGTAEAIRDAVLDMRATRPGFGRVIFEVKTITETNEIDQCRVGLSLLLEYRFF